ncbi:hypothetical protein PHYSODRAFT_511380 [Phytophthora sojae]|uniref:Phosphatidic acid phosphatase type 2/haloperoxidase domain-containing protein n=1 Tax=Phytophthora sojae (strain P6497) TaxID=1094619 RepID=G4ZU09_PHYSP|nr:hypothetical protein PHYSODRAFT_511380 [Phytophthora sojae]EGZ13283.1 hypothetical protein PHYSODRAFT_511380 [Phytophthora sojae]|eukprot:XP_009530712.1 hypothetical protein PHYSODRAFT_511380 [Phytophthora sojae]
MAPTPLARYWPLVLSAAALLAAPALASSDSDDDSVDYVRCTTFAQCCEMWGEDSKRCERGPCTGTWIMRKFFSLSMPLYSVTFWEVVYTVYSMVPYLVLITIIVEALLRSRCYTRVFAILLPIILTVLNTVILVKVLGDCDDCPRPRGSCLVSNGLPSGHATNAIGLWIWIVLEAIVGVGERVRRWSVGRKAVVVFFATLVLTPVPYSRYFLGDHTALQVSVGSADGLGLGVAYFFFIRWEGMHRAVDALARFVARYVKFEIKDDFYLTPSQTAAASGDDATIADDSSESENAGANGAHAAEKEIQTPYVQAFNTGSMKTAYSSSDDGHPDRSADGNVENLKFEETERAEAHDDKHRRPSVFRVGSRVERELDGLWFPGTITDAEPNSDCYEVEYDEDMNREGEVSATKKELTAHQREMLRKDSLLMQTPDYDPNKAPTVVLHHQGETNAAAGYIINGLENNVATGNGLRGIRWLRGNSF